MLNPQPMLGTFCVTAAQQPARFAVGDEIEGNFRGEGAWYPGVVFKVIRAWIHGRHFKVIRA